MSNGQLMVAKETTYATAVTVTRGTEYNPPIAPIKGIPGRTMGDPIRPGSRGLRKDRVTPYLGHGEGKIPLDVMDKGFGFYLEHMLGTVGTTGPVSTYYTHTATDSGPATLFGKSFTAQFAYPFTTTQTAQPVTWAGGKIKQWTFSNSVDADLLCEFDCDFATWATGTALATYAPPSSMTNLTWAGGVITVGGTGIPVTEVSISGNNNNNARGPRIDGTTVQKEPTPGRLDVQVELETDWEALTHWNRVHGTSQAAIQAAFTAVWTAGSASLTVTIPCLEFEDIDLSGDLELMQSLTGTARYDGTNSIVSIAYVTTDATP